MPTQLKLDLTTLVPAIKIKFHCCFIHDSQIFMRVKPTGFLLNSNLVNDVIARGDIFVVNLSKGTLRAFSGNIDVQEIDVLITEMEE